MWFFPRLKHLELKKSHFEIAGLLPINSDLDGPYVFRTIESLAIDILPMSWNGFQKFMSYLPNIKALTLRCSSPQIPRAGDDMYIGRLADQELCKDNLVVLDIFGNRCYGMLPEGGIRKAVREFKNLQVLILPVCSPAGYMDGLVMDILNNLRMLRSLLGIMGDDRIDSLPCLIYKTSNQSSRQILRKSSGSTWRPVREYSDDWCEAQGMKHFYIQESLRNLKLIHSTSIHARYHHFRFDKKRWTSWLLNQCGFAQIFRTVHCNTFLDLNCNCDHLSNK
mgnify:CR=1 FL=1